MESSATKTIFVNNAHPAYKWLNEQQKKTPKELYLSTAVLSRVGLNPSLDSLISQQDPSGCFPKDACNNKDTALALLALKETTLDTTKTINWLLGSQNSIENGLWQIKIEAPSISNSSCNLGSDKIDISNGLGIKNLQLPQDEIIQLSLNCTVLDGTVSTQLSHTYLGNAYIIYSSTKKEDIIKINNNGCFGVNYKSDCDYESTLYSVYSLKQNNVDVKKSIAWLEKNYNEIYSLHHAFLSLISGFSYSKNWLINNQRNNGAWSNISLISNKSDDIIITSIASAALINTKYGGNALNFLKDKGKGGSWSNDVLETAYALYFSFAEDKLKASLSIRPALISLLPETKPTLILSITNKGAASTPVSINLPTGVSITRSSLTINPKETASVFVDIDSKKITQNSKITVNYGDKSYNIPILIASGEIKTFTTNPLRFLTDKSTATFTINPSESKEGSINFKNFGDVRLNNIKLELTGELTRVVSLDKTSFTSIEPNETKSIFARINKNNDALPGFYSGELIINSSEGISNRISLEVNVNTEIKPITAGPVEKTTNLLGEEQILVFNATVEEEEEQKSTGGGVLILLIVVILLIVLSLVIWGKIKKKKAGPKQLSQTDVFKKSLEGKLRR